MQPSRRPPAGWWSYDSVAQVYEQAAVPRFAPVARDLVAAVAPPDDATVLDVGTGTGLAARITLESLGPRGSVVGIDPSAAMLRCAQGTPALALVAGMVPGLPFPDDVFDAAIANLVLSHLPDYEEGLADVARVLRPGGRFGCTAWGPSDPALEGNQGAEADELVESLMTARGLDLEPPGPVVPWEERFRVRDNLDRALRDAELVPTLIDGRTYRWIESVDAYVLGRDWRPRSRYIRERAGERAWNEARERAAAELHRRFGESIRSMGRMWIAVGTKS